MNYVVCASLWHQCETLEEAKYKAKTYHGKIYYSVETIKQLIERCAELAECHDPIRFRGGYADGLIESNPMQDIAEEIRKLKEEIQ